MNIKKLCKEMKVEIIEGEASDTTIRIQLQGSVTSVKALFAEN